MRSVSGLLGALSFALPSEEQTWLIQACLSTGNRAREAWSKWEAHLDDPIKFLRTETEGVKGMLPFILTSLREKDIDISGPFQISLKASILHEERRLEAYEGLCGELLSAFNGEGIQIIVFNGADLAYTIYDDPINRHTDGLDLLLHLSDLGRAVGILEMLEYTVTRTRSSSGSRLAAAMHASGLSVTLHASVFDIPHGVPTDELWARSRPDAVAHVPTRVFSPGDNLLFTCVNACLQPNAAPVRWACDAALLVARCPDLDWQILIDFGHRARLALTLFTTLEYLTRRLLVAIPHEVLARLRDLALKSDRLEREMALHAVDRSRRGGIRRLFRSVSGWRARAFVLLWMLFPSPAYAKWIDRAGHDRHLFVSYLANLGRWAMRLKRTVNAHG